MTQPLHGTAIADWCPGRGWRGVWITGPSGAGKSDLALRLIGRGRRLVADDRAHVFVSGDALYATSPRSISGLIEARGIGVISACVQGQVRLVLEVRLGNGPPERLPEPVNTTIAGATLPVLALSGSEASAVEKVIARLDTL